MNIYVGNLNYRVREDDLKQVMEEYEIGRASCRERV